MGLIITVSSNPFKHKHLHHCPYCKKYKLEDNTVCRREFDHPFYCYTCTQHFREAFGMLDALLDVGLDAVEMERFKGEWQESPDKNPTEFTG